MRDEEVLRAWLDTIAAADKVLRLEGAAHAHRQNLEAMKRHFIKLLNKAERHDTKVI